MRKCSVCKIEKDLDEFHKKANDHSYMCKECRKIYIRNHYKNNKTKYIEKAKKSNEKAVEAFNQMKSELKCVKCGESHIACLDFHHLDPNKKEASISRLINSTKKLQQEIEKCIVLCSNCHRKLHWEEKYSSVG